MLKSTNITCTKVFAHVWPPVIKASTYRTPLGCLIWMPGGLHSWFYEIILISVIQNWSNSLPGNPIFSAVARGHYIAWLWWPMGLILVVPQDCTFLHTFKRCFLSGWLPIHLNIGAEILPLEKLTGLGTSSTAVIYWEHDKFLENHKGLRDNKDPRQDWVTRFISFSRLLLQD